MATPMSNATPTGARDDVRDPPRVKVSQEALFFPTPIETNVENTVEFTNVEDSLVLFKIKTSQIDRYVVRPKVGIIQPRGTQRVRFVLLADQLKNTNDAMSDRFSVHLRFAKKSDPLNDPAKCWASDKTTAMRVHLACKFPKTDDLPSGLSCRLEQPTPAGGAAKSASRARSAAGGPAATAATVAADAIAAAGEAAADATPAAAGMAASGSKDLMTPLSTVGSPDVARAIAEEATRNAAAAFETSKSHSAAFQRQFSGGPVSGGSAANSAVTRPPLGTRSSAFKQVVRPSIPTVIVLPLMALCFFAGIHSETWMAHVEGAFNGLQTATTGLFDAPLSMANSATGAASSSAEADGGSAAGDKPKKKKKKVVIVEEDDEEEDSSGN